MLTQTAKYIRKYRLDNRISPYQMATDLGISTAKLAAIESGKTPITNQLKLRLIYYMCPGSIEAKEFDRLAIKKYAID